MAISQTATVKRSGPYCWRCDDWKPCQCDLRDWDKPHIIREGDRYFFTRPIDELTGEKIEVTTDVQGWIDQANQQTILGLAKACLIHSSTSTHYPLPSEVRRAILTIFGPEVDAQLQADLLKPL